MNVTPEVLAELRRLHLNATAAPWVVEEHIDGILTVETSDEAIWKRLDILQISLGGKERLRGEFNGRFIALVRNNIGALLDELEAVRAERDRLLADVATYQRTMSICVSEGHKDAVKLVEMQAAAREMLDATFENGCSGHSDVAEQCPICRAHGKLSAALGAAP